MRHMPLLLALAAFAMVPAGANAASCKHMIEKTQAKVDKLLDAIAATGPTAPESTDALLNHQPTPDAIAQEEAQLGDGKRPDKALAALDRARQAQQAGDEAACKRAVAQARKEIGS